MSIAVNLQELRKHIPSHVKLICVSKFHPESSIIEAYDCGERVFGENKVQELTRKYENLPTDIQWHFIGHLQTNKVKYIVPFVDLIHGIDSVKLLAEVNKQAAKVNRKVNCLLQMHIAQEETKFGFDEKEISEFLETMNPDDFSYVNICGLMGMATFTDNKEQTRSEFKNLKRMFDKIKNQYLSTNHHFTELSMGMSDDYQIAIEEGSTMIRIGTTIFGNRVY